MTIAAWLGFLAGVLGVGQTVPYLRSILRGQTRLSRVAVGIWLATDALTVGSLAAAGAQAAIILPLGFLGASIVLAILSVKYGVAEFTKRHWAAVVVALVAIGAWVTLGPRAAVVGMALAQSTAAVMVLDKLRHHPRTEDALAWALTGLASVLSFTAVLVEGNADWAILTVPGLSALGAGAVVTLIGIQRNRWLKT